MPAVCRRRTGLPSTRESGAVLDPFEHLRPRVVEQDDAGGNQHPGAEVGVAAADGFGGVDQHWPHPPRRDGRRSPGFEADHRGGCRPARTRPSSRRVLVSILAIPVATRKFFLERVSRAGIFMRAMIALPVGQLGRRAATFATFVTPTPSVAAKLVGRVASARAFATAFGGRSALGLRSRQQLSMWARPVSESPSPASARAPPPFRLVERAYCVGDLARPARLTGSYRTNLFYR